MILTDLPAVSTVPAIAIGICIAVVTLAVLYSKPRTGQRRHDPQVFGRIYHVPLRPDLTTLEH